MSYMNDKSILKEGLIDAIVKKLFLRAANAEIKSLDPDAKPVKIDKYKI